MKLDKNYITALKHEPIENLMVEPHCRTTDMIVEAFNRNSSMFTYTVLTKEVLIAMLFVMRIKFTRSRIPGKFSCIKLSDYHSFNVWLYREIITNPEEYKSIFGEDTWQGIPSPCDIKSLPPEFITEFGDVVLHTSETSGNLTTVITDQVNTKAATNILWITRHHMFKDQYDTLCKIFGNVKVYQYRGRTVDYKAIIDVCLKYDIKVLAVVLPDDLIVSLRNRLSSDIKIIRAKVVDVPNAEFTVVNEFGEIINKSSQYITGFEEVKGYTIVTADFGGSV